MEGKKEILVVSGTRPEFIKLFPVVAELDGRSWANRLFVSTGQHTDLVSETVSALDIVDFDVEYCAVEYSSGGANAALAGMLTDLSAIGKKYSPDMIIVQGDTTSTLAGALFGFNNKIPVMHVEAGIRTYKREPYPEEGNRQIVSRIADISCCPTEYAAKSLGGEHIQGRVCVTGNTEIDAVYYALDNCIPKKHYTIDGSRRSIVVTLHRRGNVGPPIINACRDIVKLANAFELDIFVTKHPNPSVSKLIEEHLGDQEINFNSSIMVIDPMDFVSFIHQVVEADIVITDSGGIQENTAALGIPSVIVRDSTGRPEGAESCILAGTDPRAVYDATASLLKSATKYGKLSEAACPFGDGTATKQIVDIIAEELCM